MKGPHISPNGRNEVTKVKNDKRRGWCPWESALIYTKQVPEMDANASVYGPVGSHHNDYEHSNSLKSVAIEDSWIELIKLVGAEPSQWVWTHIHLEWLLLKILEGPSVCFPTTLVLNSPT